MLSFQILGFHRKKSPHDGRSLFPASGLSLQLFAPVACQSIEASPAVILGGAPFGGDRTLLFQPQQHRIQSALVDGENIPADLLDPSGNPVAMQRPQNIQSFKHHERQGALSYVSFLHISIGFPTWKDVTLHLGKQQDLARRIEQISGNQLQLNQGTIYPALLGLEQMGWISSKWGVSETTGAPSITAEVYSENESARRLASWDVKVKGIDYAVIRNLPITSIIVQRWLDRLSPGFDRSR